MKMKSILLPATIASALAFASTQAAVLVQYGFTGDSLNPTTQISGLTGSAFGSNGITNLSFGTQTTGSTTGSPNRFGDGLNTFGDAADTDRYWVFTVTPDSGQTVTINSFAFNYSREEANSPSVWFLRSDKTGGFTANDANNIKGPVSAPTGRERLSIKIPRNLQVSSSPLLS